MGDADRGSLTVSLRKRLGVARRNLARWREEARRVSPEICTDVKTWATATPQAEYIVLDAPETAVRPLPRTVEAIIDPSFEPLCTYQVPERALVKIPHGRVRGKTGLVILPTGEFMGELVAMTADGQRRMLAAEPSYYSPMPRGCDVLAGDFYPVLGIGVGHYYHWSHDVIMRMRGIAEHIPPDLTLLVPERMAAFQSETLGLLGLDSHPQLPLRDDQLLEVENLYVVSPTLKTQIDSPAPYQWFRMAAFARYGLSSMAPTRRLFLTRRYDGHWRATNESQVETALTRHGFETVAPGQLSFRQQVELFAQAELIVGTGAGLMNMVFSPPGVKVLQFQEPTAIVHALWTMAAAMGIEYHYLLCDAVPNPSATNSDMRVPLDKLEVALAQLMAPGGE